ncbi:MAG: hypothetical protein C4519_03325 [Desulfobacteraceae bacterium]|nr:MAG: hypothetical protein C4519_03325 [Desulfobacteraceae bacterium]
MKWRRSNSCPTYFIEPGLGRRDTSEIRNGGAMLSDPHAPALNRRRHTDLPALKGPSWYCF